MTPYYQEDGITIYHGDCREMLPTLTGIDLVFTSPPYNLGDMSGGLANLAGGYDTYSDTLPDDDYVAWQQSCIALMWGTLSDVGAIFYNHKPVVRNRAVRLPTRLLPDDLPLRQIIIWNHSMGTNWSPSHFLPVHEWIMVIARDGWRLRTKSESHASDVWTVRPEMSDAEHPAPFPLALPAKAIAAAMPRRVLDPFSGSGTTLRAAKDAGVSAVGVELSERYCEIAARRLSQGVLNFGGAA